MMEIFRGKTKSGKELLVRYPVPSDLHAMWSYINTLSQEKTYILYQGEEVSLEEEQRFLTSILEGIQKRTALYLLTFIENELASIAGIEMNNLAKQHLGVLGISVAKKFRGDGVGDLVMQLLIEEAKRQLPTLKIITLDVFSTNKAAIQLYEKHGFTMWGRLPQGVKHRDQLIDSLYFSLAVT